MRRKFCHPDPLGLIGQMSCRKAKSCNCFNPHNEFGANNEFFVKRLQLYNLQPGELSHSCDDFYSNTEIRERVSKHSLSVCLQVT